MNCIQAKNIDIITFLGTIGHRSVKQSGNNYWFNLRAEKTASLKVDQANNVWFDHGSGKGGKLIDLVTYYYTNGNVKEALKFIESSGKSMPTRPSSEQMIKEPDKTTIIKISQIIENQALIQYLGARKISMKLANKYLTEIFYQANGKNYFSLGFKNDAGGYATRNKYFKGCIGASAVTTIDTGSSTLNIFEGVFDFLTAAQVSDQSGTCSPISESFMEQSTIILNSTANVQSCIDKLANYLNINTYLDNDTGGIEATNKIKAMYPQTVDRSGIYKGYNDYNDYLVQTKIGCLYSTRKQPIFKNLEHEQK